MPRFEPQRLAVLSYPERLSWVVQPPALASSEPGRSWQSKLQPWRTPGLANSMAWLLSSESFAGKINGLSIERGKIEAKSESCRPRLTLDLPCTYLAYPFPLRRVQGVYKGCPSGVPVKILWTPGEHPLYTPCTRRREKGNPRDLGNGYGCLERPKR